MWRKGRGARDGRGRGRGPGLGIGPRDGSGPGGGPGGCPPRYGKRDVFPFLPTERFKYLHMHIINNVLLHKILGGGENAMGMGRKRI